jgi:hypothetical protein
MAVANNPAAAAKLSPVIDHNDGHYMSQLDFVYELTRKSEPRFHDYPSAVDQQNFREYLVGFKMHGWDGLGWRNCKFLK